MLSFAKWLVVRVLPIYTIFISILWVSWEKPSLTESSQQICDKTVIFIIIIIIIIITIIIIIILFYLFSVKNYIYKKHKYYTNIKKYLKATAKSWVY